jgi:hypothetical protein
MYLLLPLALIAVLLLIDPPTIPVREHLTATNTIKRLDDQTTDTAELQRRAGMVPEPMKSDLLAMYQARPMPGKTAEEFVGLVAGFVFIDPAFDALYAPATAPLTEADIDTYLSKRETIIRNSSLYGRDTNTVLGYIASGNAKTLLTSYFVATSSSPPPSDTPKTLEELKTDYDAKSKEYKTLIDEAVASGSTQTMDKIRKLNVELASLLEQMISTVSPGRSIESARDELVRRLRRIQMDYNGLLQTTDELETLRRIRAQEEGGFLRVFYWHLIALGVLFVGVLGVMLYMRRQTSTETTASPTTSADLA